MCQHTNLKNPHFLGERETFPCKVKQMSGISTEMRSTRPKETYSTTGTFLPACFLVTGLHHCGAYRSYTTRVFIVAVPPGVDNDLGLSLKKAASSLLYHK